MDKEIQGWTRVWIIAGCLLVAVFLQTTLTRYNPWLGYIDWLLLVAVYVSSLRDPVLALLTATAAGALYDASSGGAPMGVNGLAKVLATYLAYWVRIKIVAENLLVSVLNVAAASVVDTLVKLAFYRMLKFDYLPPLAGRSATLAAVAMGLFANLMVSIPLYILLDRVFKASGARSRRSEAMRMRRR